MLKGQHQMTEAAPPAPGYWQASDGNWYPPEQHPQYQPPPAPQVPSPQKKGRKGLWIGIGVGTFFVLGAIGAATGNGSDKKNVSLSSKSEAVVTTTAPAIPTTAAPKTAAPTTAPPTTAAPTTTTPPTTAAPTTTTQRPTTTTRPEPSISVSQENAHDKAADYLAYSAFSRSGLIKQLEFEGFSTADATFGADSVKADWNQQAAKKAKDYLSYSSFSAASLQRQLEFEGFTASQAQYGVSTTGLS
jgi:hypothetical protein